MEPTAALRSIETTLRTAIRRIFDGDTWLDAPGAPKRDDLQRKRAEEERRRDGAIASPDLLDYAETYHLTKIALKSWEKFKPIFTDKKRTEVYFGIVEDVRNSIAHSRDVVPFEQSLLSGVAEHLGNLMSLHGTSDDATQRYYPTIEKVIDSFGTVGDQEWASSERACPRLEVGQKVRFQGRAVSARGKSIKWQMSRDRPTDIYAKTWEIGTGDVLDYEWTVTSQEVGERVEYAISIVSESAYHRHTEVVLAARAPLDDYRYFTYSINPPADD